MALRKQPVTVLLQGLNQKAPGTVGILGQLEIAENIRIQKGTAAGIELVRRNGLVEVADSPSASLYQSFRMVSFGGGIVAQDGQGSFEKFSRNTSSFSSVGYQEHGAVGIVRTDLQTGLKQASGAQTPTQTNKDIAFVGSLACYAWVDQDGAAQFAVRDSNGIILANDAAVSSGATNTKIVALGTSWYLFWKEANAIKATVISSTTYAAAAATTVVAAGSALAGTDYDIQAGFNTTNIALLYRSAAGTYVRCLLSTALAVGTTASDATAANQPNVALCWLSQATFGASLYYATLNTANGLKLQTINATTLAITATASQAGAPVTNVRNMTGGSTAYPLNAVPFALIDYEFTDGAGVVHRVTDLSNAASAALPLMSGALASRVTYMSGVAMAAFLYRSDQAAGTVTAPQPTLVIANAFGDATFAGVIKAKAFPGSAGAPETFSLSSWAADASGSLHGLFSRGVLADTVGGTVTVQYSLSDVAISERPRFVSQPLSFGGVALVPGGELWEVDNSSGYPSNAGGEPAHEQGFRTKPEIPVLTEGAAASGSVPPGVRSFVVRWKWTDSSGQVYRSAISTPVAITTVNANSSVAVKIYGPNALTARQYVQAEVFVTPKDGTGDIYYRVTPAVFAVDSVVRLVTTFTHTASEATIAAGEPLEVSTETGVVELENIAPPALNDVIEHDGRAFGIDAEQPWRVRFSKQYTPGQSVGFTDAFIAETPQGTGPIYKLMSMDGHLIAIKRDAIYVWAGDFPDNTGAGTIPSYSLLPVGVGTEQPRSVVLTELGIMFYSSKRGFWLLNRSLGVKYIGAAVETTAANQTVSGATVHPTYPEVRFTTEGGTTFVFNTLFTEITGTPIWTTFTGQACVHSIVHEGDWYLLTSTGKLLKEDLTRWQDGVALGGGAFTAGTAFTRRAKVTDINFAGVNGFARVYEGALTGEWYASEKVKITITNNHRTTDPETGLPAAERPFTYDATINPDPYVLKFSPAIQKVTAMDVLIEDTSDYQTQGSAWTALSFTVGVKGGQFRQGVSHSMSGGQRRP